MGELQHGDQSGIGSLSRESGVVNRGFLFYRFLKLLNRIIERSSE
jgi:hypothetical protein